MYNGVVITLLKFCHLKIVAIISFHGKIPMRFVLMQADCDLMILGISQSICPILAVLVNNHYKGGGSG